jgi:O-antigen/teichoic acid export membrane protein
VAGARALAKHSMIYGMGSLLSRLLGFFLLPIYTRYLSPADYGILSLLVTTGSVTDILIRLGLGSGIFREVIYRRSDESQVESTALYFLAGESILLFSVFLLFSSPLSSLIFGSPIYARLLSFVFLSSLLDILNMIAMARLRIHERSFFYATISVGKFLMGALLNIYFVAVLRRGVEGLVVSSLIQAGLSAGFSLALIIPNLRPTFSVPILRRLLSFGLPLVPFGLSRLIMTYADRYFLQHYYGTAEVGLYSLGYNIGLVLNIVVTAVQTAWPAQMFAMARKPDPERQFSRLLTYYLGVLGFVSLGFSVLAPEVLIVMTTPRYHRAWMVVPLVTLSYVLYGMMFMTNTGLETQNKVKYAAPVIAAAACLNLGLNFLLIPSYGMMGAAVATFLSYLLFAAANTAVNLHFWYIPYEYGRIGKLTLAWGSIYGASLLIRAPNVWVGLILKLFLLATFPLLLYAFRFYKDGELARFHQVFQSGWSRMCAWRAGA